MMENDGEAGDDEGSGWFEVKKKHRASSKLSTQKVSGGPSNKVHSYSPCLLASTDDEAGNTQSRRQLRALKVGLDFAARSKVSTESSSPASVEGDRGTGCLVELGVSQESEPPGVLLCTSMKDANLESGTETTREVPSIGNSDDALRIKWGNLEDVPLALHECCGDSGSCAKVNYGDVANGNIEDHDDSIKVIATSEDEGQFPDVMISSAVQEKSLEETRTEVNEIPSKDMEVGKFDSNDAVLNLKEKHDGDARTTPVEVNGTLLQGPHDISSNEALSISEVSATNENAGMLDTILPQDQRSGAGISGGASVTSSLEDRRRMLDASTDGAEIGEGELEESKERFRERLWCFLFENLNRAVDELYLLCELECDMGQMNEAIVVLEEARSDFRELKCRVEHFETTKKASSQSSKDGTPVNVKTDHRRPHALSWEVRRMTTSPHRAEILSSSLEAFKKIQQERASKHVTHNAKDLDFSHSTPQHTRISRGSVDVPPNSKEPGNKSEKATVILETDQGNPKAEKQNVETTRPSKARLVQIGRSTPQSLSASTTAKCKKESVDSTTEIEKQVHKKDKVSAESRVEKNPKAMDMVKRHSSLLDKEKEKEKERRTTAPWKSMDAWKEKRNWEDILKSPLRSSSRVSHSPGVNRKGTDRARVLHDKLMSPEKKKKSALDMKREAEEKHARATRIRSQLENERVQRLHRTSEKLNRVNEWQAVRSLKLREGMYARHQLSESRHEAYLAQVARRAGDESSKVNEVRFITSLNEENKKLILRQKLHDSEMRRAEKLQVIRTKQKDIAREEAVLERRKLLEAEKLQRLAETQRKKEEAQVRREEERKASSAAREAKAVEQLRRKEVRAKAQQEEAELLAQRLAERLSESEQRRKYYLEQIREKASMDFRDQSSPLLRRSVNKEGQSRLITTNSADDYQTSCISSAGDSAVGLVNATQQHPLKRRIKKIRQRLMALKYEPTEPPLGTENAGTGCKAIVGAARVKIGRWLQDLQRLRQARKEGAASIGLIVSDMVKFLEGKDPELHASRHAGLLDFISSALPASHTSKPEACQVTVYLLRLLRVVLSVPVNRSYFLAQNLLPPIIPMLSASLENYIKIVASSNPGSTNLLPNKTSTENLESIAEALDGFLWTVTTIMGHVHFDERQLQMQDGLMELIVAYQVIHRLRDLFALYDRPQVEGSPFPSSILISLNLLAVLTSRHGTVSSIDWESGIPKAELSNGFQEPKDVVCLGMGDSLVENISGDCTSHPIVHAIEDLAANESGQIFGEEKLPSSKVCLPEIPEGQPLDGECRKESSGISNGLDNGEAALQMHARSPSAESRSFALEEHAKSLLNHRDERNSMGGGAERKTVNERAIVEDNESRKESNLKQPIIYLLSTINKTGLVSLPSLLTGVLLQANNRLSSEQAFYILPSNFEEVATGVLKVLNNLAILDITLLQSMLARSDLKMEFFHLMSFLLSHCSSKWKATNDQVGLLLLECLLLLGYFALFHTGNQAVLRWGKTPTILHKVCDLPFVFFSDPELTPILAGTLVAACYGSEQNKGVVEQELSTDMLLSLLRSCRQGLFSTQSDMDALTVIDPCDANQTVTEVRKPQSDAPGRSNRKSARVSLGRGGVTISSSIKASKIKVQKDSRGTRTCDEWAVKHSLPASQASSTFMLHRRFPTTFLDRAEEFFSSLPV